MWITKLIPAGQQLPARRNSFFETDGAMALRQAAELNSIKGEPKPAERSLYPAERGLLTGPRWVVIWSDAPESNEYGEVCP